MTARRSRAIWKTAALSAVAVILTMVSWLAYENRPKVLAVRVNDDGTSRAIVAKPRLCGLMGIEIVMQDRAADGSPGYASVQDLVNSWDQAVARYQNPTGGGLLEPIPSNPQTEYGGP